MEVKMKSRKPDYFKVVLCLMVGVIVITLGILFLKDVSYLIAYLCLAVGTIFLLGGTEEIIFIFRKK